jgi:hypothetical protein
MSHLQAVLRTSELFIKRTFWGPKMLITFTSSWGRLLSASAGSESYTRTEEHPPLPTGQQPLKQKEL